MTEPAIPYLTPWYGPVVDAGHQARLEETTETIVDAGYRFVISSVLERIKRGVLRIVDRMRTVREADRGRRSRG